MISPRQTSSWWQCPAASSGRAPLDRFFHARGRLHQASGSIGLLLGPRAGRLQRFLAIVFPKSSPL
jgi:hypothetical protein